MTLLQAISIVPLGAIVMFLGVTLSVVACDAWRNRSREGFVWWVRNAAINCTILVFVVWTVWGIITIVELLTR